MTKTTASTETELAADIAAGLRCLAVMIEQYPDLAQDMRYSAYHSLLGILLENQHAGLARWARAGKASGGKVTKSGDNTHFELGIEFGPVRVRAIADRDEVCERVVVGTETFTRKVKDPAVLAAVPEIEVTEDVEQVKWVCRPLLADDSESAVVPALAESAVAS